MFVLRLEADLLQEPLPLVCFRVRLERQRLPRWATEADVNMVAVADLFTLHEKRLESPHVGCRLRSILGVHRLPIRQPIFDPLNFCSNKRGRGGVHDKGEHRATEQAEN